MSCTLPEVVSILGATDVPPTGPSGRPEVVNFTNFCDMLSGLYPFAEDTLFHCENLSITCVPHDCLQITLGTNFFGPLLLTQLLLPVLKTTPPARVVWVTSPEESMGETDWSDIK